MSEKIFSWVESCEIPHIKKKVLFVPLCCLGFLPVFQSGFLFFPQTKLFENITNLSESFFIADENETMINQEKSFKMESGTFLEMFDFILSAINTVP